MFHIHLPQHVLHTLFVQTMLGMASGNAEYARQLSQQTTPSSNWYLLSKPTTVIKEISNLFQCSLL